MIISTLLLSCSEDIVPVEDEVTKSVNEQLIELMNNIRTNGYESGNVYYTETSPLTLNDLLTEAAQKHCDYMAEKGKATHYGNTKETETLKHRLYNVGFSYMYCAEDVTKTNLTEPTDILNYWLERECFCEMLMTHNADVAGIAHTGEYWCVIFAK